jgi:hypothetical protein
MTITISNNTNEIERSLSFRQFWLNIESLVGSNNIALEVNAKHIKQFIDNAKQPHHFVKDLITRSYNESFCNNLNSPIDVNKVLDIMGEIAWKLRINCNDDLLSVELLEEIALHISTMHAEQITVTESNKIESDKQTDARNSVLTLFDS